MFRYLKTRWNDSYFYLRHNTVLDLVLSVECSENGYTLSNEYLLNDDCIYQEIEETEFARVHVKALTVLGFNVVGSFMLNSLKVKENDDSLVSCNS